MGNSHSKSGFVDAQLERIQDMMIHNRTASVIGALAALGISSAIYINAQRLTGDSPELFQEGSASAAREKAAKAREGKVAVDMVFFRRLWRLLKILIPGNISGYCYKIHSFMLFGVV